MQEVGARLTTPHIVEYPCKQGNSSIRKSKSKRKACTFQNPDFLVIERSRSRARTCHSAAPTAHGHILQRSCTVVVWSRGGANLLLAYCILALLSAGGTNTHLSGWCLGSTLLLSQRSISLKLLCLSLGLCVVTWNLPLAEINVDGRLRDIALAGFDEAALQGDDIVAKAVVLVL